MIPGYPPRDYQNPTGEIADRQSDTRELHHRDLFSDRT
jgi:hypothetical protein